MLLITLNHFQSHPKTMEERVHELERENRLLKRKLAYMERQYDYAAKRFKNQREELSENAEMMSDSMMDVRIALSKI